MNPTTPFVIDGESHCWHSHEAGPGATVHTMWCCRPDCHDVLIAGAEIEEKTHGCLKMFRGGVPRFPKAHAYMWSGSPPVGPWRAKETEPRLADLLRRAVSGLREREWLTRNAAENTYCPDCVDDTTRWRDQVAHSGDCPFVALLKEATE